MLFSYLSLILGVVFILFSVMFVTLLERKILGYSQNRLGPTKIFFFGLLQPLLDGIKLLIKEMILPISSNKGWFVFTPLVIFVSMLLIWLSLLMVGSPLSMKMLVIFVIGCVGVTVYSNLLSGWSSNSKYSMLGAIRSSAQTISYEVILTLCLFSFLIIFGSLNIFHFSKFFMIFLGLLWWPMILLWCICCLAECGRAPLDFAEGESELVSGFNTEYGSGEFAVLFIGEYGMLIYFSLFTVVISVGEKMIWILGGFMIWLFLLVRSCYPRYRYDKFMTLTWEKLLPVVILILIITLMIVLL